jgi:hypothetical protein
VRVADARRTSHEPAIVIRLAGYPILGAEQSACGVEVRPVMTASRTSCRCTPSFQLIGHLVDPGLDASFVLFTAWRPRRAGRTDHLIPELDRECALVGDDVG